jgi:uncharacterized protein (TIGR02246 family)
VSNNLSARGEDSAAVIDRLVFAYNAHDARGFADLFAIDAIHGSLRSESPQVGREAIFERYVDVFAQFPQNHTEVTYRVVVGNFVVDHERVRRSPETEPFDVVAVYEVRNGEIVQFDMVRE